MLVERKNIFRDTREVTLSEKGFQKWPRTADSVTGRFLEGRSVRWALLPAREVQVLLDRASDELKIPTAFFTSEEFMKPLDMFGGGSLRGLYKFAHNHPLREKKKPVSFLLDELDIKATVEDVIAAMKYKLRIDWSRLPPTEIKLLLEKAATELGKPANNLVHGDFLTNLKFLNGKSLLGLYRYSLTHEDNKDESTTTFLLERAGIADEIFVRMRRMGEEDFFDQASWEEIGAILKRMAGEMKKPVSRITYKDITGYHVEFLGGRQIRGLRLRMIKEGLSTSDLLAKIGAIASVEDVIAKAKAGTYIYWVQVPLVVTKQLLEMAAGEIGKSTTTLTANDLYKSFDFLGRRSLGGLHAYINRQQRELGKSAIAALMEQVSITITAEDVIEGLKNKQLIMWNRVAWKEMRRLIEMAAEELGILPEMIGSQELAQTYNFLRGGTLNGVYSYVCRSKEKQPEDSALSFLRGKIGIKDGLRPYRTSRVKYRVQKTDSIFGELLPANDSLTSMEGLLPAIRSISRLYTNPFLNIETDEIVSEAVVFALDFVAQGRPASEFSFGLNAHLEQYLSSISRPRYKEVLLSTPLTEDGKKTLADVISSGEQENESTATEFSDLMESKLAVLSPLQKKLILRLAVDEMTIEEVGREFGMDEESIQEMYHEVLSLLRSEMI